MNKFPLFTILALVMISSSSCEAVEGIFKVGLWSGIIIVVVIIAIIIWLVNRFRR